MKTTAPQKTNVESTVTLSSKIDKSDVIDAEFEDLPIKENSKETSTEKN